jgi:hypothetical protein
MCLQQRARSSAACPSRPPAPLAAPLDSGQADGTGPNAVPWSGPSPTAASRAHHLGSPPERHGRMRRAAFLGPRPATGMRPGRRASAPERARPPGCRCGSRFPWCHWACMAPRFGSVLPLSKIMAIPPSTALRSRMRGDLRFPDTWPTLNLTSKMASSNQCFQFVLDAGTKTVVARLAGVRHHRAAQVALRHMLPGEVLDAAADWTHAEVACLSHAEHKHLHLLGLVAWNSPEGQVWALRSSDRHRVCRPQAAFGVVATASSHLPNLAPPRPACGGGSLAVAPAAKRRTSEQITGQRVRTSSDDCETRSARHHFMAVSWCVA